MVHSNWTIEGVLVLAHCHWQEKINPDQLRVVFAGRHLGGKRVLSDCGIRNGSTLSLLPRLYGVMQIFLLTYHRESALLTITLDVESTDTIESVKARIHDKDGIPPGNQRLTFEGTQLEGWRTLGGYGVMNMSTLELEISSSGWIRIYVQTHDRLFFLDVESSDTIGSLKAKFQEEGGTVPADQHLHFAGEQLEDWPTLADYSIENESTLHLLRLGSSIGSDEFFV